MIQTLLKKLSSKPTILNHGFTLSDIIQRIETVQALASEAHDDIEFTSELEQELLSLEKILSELEARRMLSGEMDKASCFLSINAGAGGTEACDWAEMLLRMYQRWATKHAWKTEIIDILEGEVAGIRNVTLYINGPYAYGYAKAEKGVHRLVRISPFDSNARRHTSFAAVDVVPEVAEDIKIEIRQEDLKIDTYRASGKLADSMSIKQILQFACSISLPESSFPLSHREAKSRTENHALKCFGQNSMNENWRREIKTC